MVRLQPFVVWWVKIELWVLACALPFFIFPGQWRVLLGLLLVGSSWLARRVTIGYWSRPTPLVGPVLWLGLMGVVGYIVSVDAQMSWGKLWGVWGQIAVFWGVINGLKDDRDWRLIRWGYLLLPLAIATVSLIGTDWSQVRLLYLPIIYDHIPQVSFGLPGSGVPVSSDMFHVRQVGATMALLLPSSFVWMIWGTGVERWVAGIATVVTFTLLVLSQSLMGIFGVAVVLFGLLVWRWRKAIWLGIGSVILLSTSVLIYGPRRLLLVLLDPQDVIGLPVVLRLDMWNSALRMMSDMPITGIGLNTYPLIQNHFYTGYLLGAEPHAHNLFLQTAIDFGLPGLWAFCTLILLFLWQARQAYIQINDAGKRVWILAAVASVGAYLVSGLLDTMTLGAKPVAVWWAWLALPTALVAMNQNDDKGMISKQTWGNLWWWFSPLLLILFLCTTHGMRNMAAWSGHQAIYQARTGNVDQVLLEKAVILLDQNWGKNGALWYVQGSVFAWQGDSSAAWYSWIQQVDADSENPLGYYAPFIAWHNKLQGVSSESGQSQKAVYRIWQTRYPQRADYYVLLALTEEMQGDMVAGGLTLDSGIEKEARPSAILIETWFKTED